MNSYLGYLYVQMVKKWVSRRIMLAGVDTELRAALAVSEEQFSRGNYKTLQEAEVVLEATWQKSQDVDHEP